MNLLKLKALWSKDPDDELSRIMGKFELRESEIVIDLDRVIQFHPVDKDDTVMVDLSGGDAVRLKMTFYEFYSIMSGIYSIDESFYQ